MRIFSPKNLSGHVHALSNKVSVLDSLDGFFDRVPWLLPVIGFGAGWMSFLLVQRGDSLARVIALTVLAGWAWLLIQPWMLRVFRRHLKNRTVKLMSNFVSQSLQQEILFFCLPFLLLSTQTSSPGQMLFTMLVFTAALISTLDPVYEKYIASDRIISLAFHSLCTFVSALIVLPIVVKIPVEKTFFVSLGFVTLWLIFSLPRLYQKFQLQRRRAGILASVILIPLVLLAFRGSIPPAGIEVTRASITNLVSNHEPVQQVTRLSPEQLERGVYAFAAIRAPRGLDQEVIFEWRHDDYVDQISSTITGGREEGYRTYAMKRNFSEEATGEWQVNILTPQGQLLKTLEFEVLDDTTVSRETLSADGQEPESGIRETGVSRERLAVVSG